jgi:hypothetical protein
MAKKIAIANAPPPPQKPPSESISIDISKMPPNVAVAGLAKAGIQATVTDFQQHAADQLNQAVQKKAIPAALAEHNKPPQGGEQPRQLRR